MFFIQNAITSSYYKVVVFIVPLQGLLLYFLRNFSMIYAGIDVTKNKHDYFITNSDSEVLFKAFTIPNNRDGVDELYQKIASAADDLTKVKVGVEATNPLSV